MSAHDPGHDPGEPPSDSGLVAAVARVGDRWTLLLVDALLHGPQRFGQLQDAVEGISPNVLSARLKHLEAEAIVVATRYSQRPTRYAYELTEAGRELAGALQLLADWGSRHSTGDEQALRHEACGTPVEARWWCPTCGVPLDDEDAGLYHL